MGNSQEDKGTPIYLIFNILEQIEERDLLYRLSLIQLLKEPGSNLLEPPYLPDLGISM